MQAQTQTNTNFFNYDPNHLLNSILEKLELKNDASLCRFLELKPHVISKIRNFHVMVSPYVLIRMHEKTGLSIGELRALMGDKRKKYMKGGERWVSAAPNDKEYSAPQAEAAA